MKVRLSDYNEDWVRLYQEEADFLKSIFEDQVVRFEILKKLQGTVGLRKSWLNASKTQTNIARQKKRSSRKWSSLHYRGSLLDFFHKAF